MQSPCQHNAIRTSQGARIACGTAFVALMLNQPFLALSVPFGNHLHTCSAGRSLHPKYLHGSRGLCKVLQLWLSSEWVATNSVVRRGGQHHQVCGLACMHQAGICCQSYCVALCKYHIIHCCHSCLRSASMHRLSTLTTKILTPRQSCGYLLTNNPMRITVIKEMHVCSAPDLAGVCVIKLCWVMLNHDMMS